MTKSRGINQPRHRWTTREVATLRRRYPHERTADIARDLGIRLAIVFACANRMGLHKSAAFRASEKSGRIFKGGKLGQATQFKPGQAPANKGLRRPGYSLGRGRMRETQFKKGSLSGRAALVVKPIGAERISHPGAGWPVGPADDEAQLTQANALLHWQRGSWYADAGLGVKVYESSQRDFVGPSVTGTVRVGREFKLVRP